MDSIRNPNGSSRGQTLIEFALIAPIMFILLFGIIDFGMALDHRITLQHAVREGARYAAVHSTCRDIQNRTADRAGDIVTWDQVCVRYFDENGDPTTSASAGDTVQVTAPYDYDFPLMPSRLGLSISADVGGSARLELVVTNAEGCCP